MAMQVDDNNENTQPSVILVENPSIDLEAYAASYTGLARVNRLLFIVDVCPSLRLEAVKIAISYVSNTLNVTLYQMLHRKLNELLASQAANAREGPNAAAALPDVAMAVDGAAAGGSSQDMPEFDPNWVETKIKNAALKLEKLDSDLKNYKLHSVKESIRRGHDDLGDHYTDVGELSNALKCYSRARDFATSGKHIVYMCLNVIKISVLMQNWTQVISYVLKAESTPDYVDSSKDAYQVVQSHLKCAAGLAELQTKKYKEAAKHFLLAQFDHCNFPDFLTPNNVALYGGLCALATFDRSELQKNVIASASFKMFLEVEPQLRDVIVYFYASNYGQCLKLLDEMRDNLLLDMYLAAHVATLYTNIRKRALIQYLSPYQSADMHRMAEAFNCPVTALENELVELILDDQIEARIDSHQKVVHAKETDERSMTFQRALQVGRDFERSARLMLLRSAMIKNQIYVKKVDTTEPMAMDSCDAATTAAATGANTQRN